MSLPPITSVRVKPRVTTSIGVLKGARNFRGRSSFFVLPVAVEPAAVESSILFWLFAGWLLSGAAVLSIL